MKSRHGGLRMWRTAGLMALAAAAFPASGLAQGKPNTDTAFFAFKFPGVFGDPGKPSGQLKIYAVRRDAKWVAAVANSNSDTGRAAYNTAFYPVDLSGVTVDGNKIKGDAKVVLVPDPWVPADRKTRHITVTLDCTVGAPANASETGSLTGKWKTVLEGGAPIGKGSNVQAEASGDISGGMGGTGPNDISDVSYELTVPDLIPGQAKEEHSRRRGISLGVKEGKVVSARIAQMDMRHNPYDHESIDTPEGFTIDGDKFSGTMSFSSDTLDGDRASFTLTLEGQRVAGFLVGTWKGKVSTGDGKEKEIAGYFRGNAKGKAYVDEAARDTRPWFAMAPGVKPFEPGEHPRLFFRKADVPELKRRAATPEGQAIIKRLRQLLNGSDGESMPTSYNPAKEAYVKNNFKAGPGTFSISHAAGYGFLYQLTGDRKYADMARECVEKSWEGQRSADDRYSWVAPGGELRAGPSIGWHAVAYDLCYDAWDPDFRTKCALAIQNYADTKGGEWNKAEGITIRSMILTPRQGPKSNHYGAVVGGCGMAILAIKDDPGTDKELCGKYLEMSEKQVVRAVSAGWGDGGYYSEGWGAARVGTQGSLLSFIQALKVATGKDFMNVERPNVNFVTMIPRTMLLMGPPVKIQYRSNMGGSYGSENLDNEFTGFSHGGYFSEGFGAIGDKYKPALLWTYNHMVSPDNGRNFDTESHYPHRPMLALINWPTFSNIKEESPEKVLPLATRDSLYEFYCFRNGFKDKNTDILVSALCNAPDGTKPREVMVWGLGGLKLTFGEPGKTTKVTSYQLGKDGSGVIQVGNYGLCVDYSRASGADALLVTTGDTKAVSDDGKVKVTKLAGPGKGFTVMTLSAEGKHPTPEIKGGMVITAGGQSITFQEGKFTFSKFTPQ